MGLSNYKRTFFITADFYTLHFQHCFLFLRKYLAEIFSCCLEESTKHSTDF